MKRDCQYDCYGANADNGYGLQITTKTTTFANQIGSDDLQLKAALDRLASVGRWLFSIDLYLFPNRNGV